MAYIRMGSPRVAGGHVEFIAESGEGVCTFVVSRETLEDLEQAQSLSTAQLLAAYHKHAVRIGNAAASAFEPGARVVLTYAMLP